MGGGVQGGWGSHAGPTEKAPGANVPGLTDLTISYNHQEQEEIHE
jgi:hypothetical protein